MITYDFSNRVAVITGAGGGMGLAIANKILDAGGAAILIDVKPEPADLAGPLLFFCSQASAYVTGQVLFVDGGYTAK